jgi:hypothetical protein
VVLLRTRRAGENINMGGFALNTLKKLKGDKLGRLWASMVLAKAIGLGATELNNKLCNLPVERALGSNDVIENANLYKGSYSNSELKMNCPDVMQYY